MAVYKATMIFQQTSNAGGTAANTRSGGWSESLYWQGSDLALLKQQFLQLCNIRSWMLSNAGLIVGQRYQRIDPLGAAFSSGQRFSGNIQLSDQPQVAITFTVPGLGVPNARRFTLRGIADARVQEGEYVPSAAFTGNLAAFVRKLGNFCFRAKNQVIDKIPLSSVAADGTFVLQQPLTYALNDYLNLSEVLISTNYRVGGRFHVKTRTDDQHGIISGWIYPAGTGGFVKLDELIFPGFDFNAEVTPIACVRKVGRPSSGYRGRASARR